MLYFYKAITCNIKSLTAISSKVWAPPTTVLCLWRMFCWIQWVAFWVRLASVSQSSSIYSSASSSDPEIEMQSLSKYKEIN